MQTATVPIALVHVGPTITLAEAAHRLCGGDIPRNQTLAYRQSPPGDVDLFWKDGAEWVSAEEYEKTLPRSSAMDAYGVVQTGSAGGESGGVVSGSSVSGSKAGCSLGAGTGEAG